MGMKIHGNSDTSANLRVIDCRAARSFASHLAAAFLPCSELRVLRERRALPLSSIVLELAVGQTTPRDHHSNCAVL